MTEKYLLFSLDDEKSKKLGEVISNPSCKKIVNFLAEKEASASEISSELKMPLNSAIYNINNLLKAGILERKGGYFWSSKGKKMERYRVANKLIVISPKKTNIYSKLKGIIPAVLISGIATWLVAGYYSIKETGTQIIQEKVADAALMAALPEATEIVSKTSLNPWIWFAFGGLLMLVLLAILNWKKL